jgi:hypothetical protein
VGFAREGGWKTMQRRKFIAGMGSLAAAGAATIGTGAFTSVQADRSLDVEVADDSNAFLALEAEDNSPNADDYVDDSGATISLDFSSTDSPGNGGGLNQDATTTIRDLIEVTNQGTQAVVVGVTNLPSSMSIYTDDSQLDYIQAQPYDSSSLNQDNYSPSSGNLPVVGVGETMDDVGVIFRDPPSNLSDTSITFNAIALSQTSLGYTPP